MLSLPYRVWGKTGSDSNPSSAGRPSYHPLICHLIDVSTVANELWEHYLAPSVRQSIETDLQLDLPQTAAWIRFLAGMHDIGKCTPEFQRKSELFSQPLKDAGLHLFKNDGTVTLHGLAGAVICKRMLEFRWHMPQQPATIWAQVTGGHHGEFGRPDMKTLFTLPIFGDEPWSLLRGQLVSELAARCELAHVPASKPSAATALIVAGLISVADWLASNQQYFPCSATLGQTTDPDLFAYCETAKSQARRALQETGWRTLPSKRDGAPFQVLFQGITPRPSQTRIDALTHSLQSPAILILEAPTGEGKTEAALQVADRLAQATGQRGFYFALPTQATSNQMFGRIRRFLEQRYTGHLLPLYLLHSHAAFLEEMLTLLEQGQLIAHLSSVGDDPAHDGLFAAEWFTKPKRGLLSPFAVGTVDQSLMAALITRHVFVRLFGLAGKVLIVDEVHAYDTYMSTLLERLLEWLGALHSFVILLSATLPRLRTQSLLAAWTRGAGLPPPAVGSTPYPRLSIAALDGSLQYADLPVSARSQRTVALTWSPRSGALQQILQRIANGGCAAIVCNTVASAQTTYRDLKARLVSLPDSAKPDLLLFHARFPFEDRQRIEKLVLELFGPGEHHRPKRALLVATQVIEQSLDLDFDLLASELAPVDLLLQRAGRLHRHQRIRPPSFSAPELLLFHPDLTPDGLPELSRVDRFVYNEYILLQTWQALKARSQIQTPDDTETLIEGVYSENPAAWGTGALRDRLSHSYRTLQTERQDEKNEAANRYIPLPFDTNLPRFTANPLDEQNSALHPRLQALTRLTEPSLTCACLFGDRQQAYLDVARTQPLNLDKKPDPKLTRQLLNRSLAISQKKLFSILCSTVDIPSAWRNNVLLWGVRPIFLDNDFQARIGEVSLRCDPEFGLQIPPDE